MASTKVLALRWEGQLLRFDDLRGEEAVEIEEKLGVPYVQILMGSRMSHRLAVLAVFLRRKMSEDEVAKAIQSLTVAQLDEMVELVEVDLPATWDDGRPLGDGASTPS